MVKSPREVSATGEKQEESADRCPIGDIRRLKTFLRRIMNLSVITMRVSSIWFDIKEVELNDHRRHAQRSVERGFRETASVGSC